MSVGRICQREVDLADFDETVQTVAGRMLQRGVGTLVVLDSDEKPVGIVTDRDLALRSLAAGKDFHETLVRDVMTDSPRAVEEETPIEDVLRLMRSGEFRRLPVVDRSGALVGIVSVDDILGLLAEELSDVGKLLSRETPRAAAER